MKVFMIRDFKVINATLNQGDTTVLINDSFITNTSIIEIYTDNFNVFPIEGRQNGTQLTITFEKQLFDTHIKVLVNNIGDTLDVPEALSDLNDVDTTGLVNGYYLKYDGTKWIPAEVEGGSGTTDYNNLTNKPSINNVTLSGNKTSHDLSLADINDLTAENISFDNTVSGMSADNVNEALDELSMTKQDTLTPGTNITITNNEISAAEPIAEALTNIVDSAIDGGYISLNILDYSKTSLNRSWNNTVYNGRATLFVDVKPSTTYTLSYGSISELGTCIAYEKTDKDSQVIISQFNFSNNYTFTTSSTTRCLALLFIPSSTPTLEMVRKAELVLVEGSTSKPYVPSNTELQSEIDGLECVDITSQLSSTYLNFKAYKQGKFIVLNIINTIADLPTTLTPLITGFSKNSPYNAQYFYAMTPNGTLMCGFSTSKTFDGRAQGATISSGTYLQTQFVLVTE